MSIPNDISIHKHVYFTICQKLVYSASGDIWLCQNENLASRSQESMHVTDKCWWVLCCHFFFFFLNISLEANAPNWMQPTYDSSLQCAFFFFFFFHYCQLSGYLFEYWCHTEPSAKTETRDIEKCFYMSMLKPIYKSDQLLKDPIKPYAYCYLPPSSHMHTAICQNNPKELRLTGLIRLLDPDQMNIGI